MFLAFLKALDSFLAWRTSVFDRQTACFPLKMWFCTWSYGN